MEQTPESPCYTKNQVVLHDATLAEAQKKLLREPRYTDLTVVCRDRVWRCSKSILCHRCEFFSAACNGPFQEAANNIIYLPEDEPDAVDAMLVFLYTLQKPNFDDKVLYPEVMSTAAKVHQIADKYNIIVLREVAKDYLLDRIRTELCSWYSMPMAAQNDWIPWIRILWMWEGTDYSEIQETLVDALVKTSRAIVDHPHFQVLLQQYQAFNLAFIKALTSVTQEPCSRVLRTSPKRTRGK